MIAEIGRNLLNFVQAVIALNNQFISTVLRVGSEAWRGTGIILSGLIQGVSQLGCYILDLTQDVLQICYSFLAVCYALGVVVVQILSILLMGLENVGACIGGILLRVLRYGYETFSAILQYLGLASLETRIIVKSGVSTSLTACRDASEAIYVWMADAVTYIIKQFAALLFCIRNGGIQIYEALKENSCVLYKQVSSVTFRMCEYLKENVPEDFYMWCACTLCLTSILLCVRKYLSRHGLTFPSFIPTCTNPSRLLYLQNERDFDMFNFSDEDPDDDDDDDEAENEDYEEEATDESGETEEDVDEYEIATSEEEESEEEENDENLINVQLPELSDNNLTLRSRATPFGDRSNRELSPEALEKILEHERDRRACVVCQDAMKCVLVLPCRHMCLCIHCAHYLVSQRIRQRICPLCRSRIETIMNVFV